jgi:hypothetical protein
MLIQKFVRPDSVVSRIWLQTAPKRLLQQYRHFGDMTKYANEGRFQTRSRHGGPSYSIASSALASRDGGKK